MNMDEQDIQDAAGHSEIQFGKACKNAKVREGAQFEFSRVQFGSVAFGQSLLRCGLLSRKWLAFVWEEFIQDRSLVGSES